MSSTIPQQRLSSERRWPLIFGFIVIIIAGHLLAFFHMPDPGLNENRVLAQRPGRPHSMQEWQTLGDKWNRFLTDQFPPRAEIIGALNYMRYRLGYSGSDRVIVGRDGWLFYDDGSHMAMAAGVRKLSNAQLDDWVRGYNDRQTYLRSRHAKLYMVLGPVQEDIFPEKRPHWMPQTRVETEVDQIIHAASKDGIDSIIDPRERLIAEKGHQELYDRYDTHWTGLGAYIAYVELMTRMHRDYPEMHPLPLSYFKPVDLDPTKMASGLSLMLGIANLVPHDRVSYATNPIHDPARTIFLSERHDWTAPQLLLTGAPGDRTLLLERDSFATELLPFLKPHFSRIISAHLQDGMFRMDLINRFKPDVVIVEVIDTGARHVMWRLPPAALADGAAGQ